jgi:single-strand DNA-binding protein
MNKVILIGRLGQDPELKTLSEGRTMARFSLATNRQRKAPAGENSKNNTQWHRVVAWDKSAELAGAYLTKGREVCVEGRIQTRKWKDSSGRDQFTTEVVAQHLTFIGRRQDSTSTHEEVAA